MAPILRDPVVERVGSRYRRMLDDASDPHEWAYAWRTELNRGGFRAVDFVMDQVVDAGRCVGCAACVTICPVDVFDYGEERPVDARTDACVLCVLCADVCPVGVIKMIDINQLKAEGALPEIEEAYGWQNGSAMVIDEERCIRCALCVKRCPFDAITMERFELAEVSTDGRLYKESYRDAQLAGTAGVAGGAP